MTPPLGALVDLPRLVRPVDGEVGADRSGLAVDLGGDDDVAAQPGPEREARRSAGLWGRLPETGAALAESAAGGEGGRIADPRPCFDVDGDGNGGGAIEGVAELVEALFHGRREDDQQECSKDADDAEDGSRDRQSTATLTLLLDLAQSDHACDTSPAVSAVGAGDAPTRTT